MGRCGFVRVQRKFCEGAAWANADTLGQGGCADGVGKVKNQRDSGCLDGLRRLHLRCKDRQYLL